MKLVMVESPLAGNYARNTAYAKDCLMDSLRRGESPFAMHLLYPQVLDDTMHEEREQGIAAGLAWSAKAELVAVYVDLGISSGMHRAIVRANERGIPVENRSGVWDPAKLCQVCFGSARVASSIEGACLYCLGRLA